MRIAKDIKIFIAKLDKREPDLDKIKIYSIFDINYEQYKTDQTFIKNIIRKRNSFIFNQT